MYGVFISPENFVKDKAFIVERSFDDLGEFDFIGLQLGAIRIGMRRHPGSRKEYSYVSAPELETNEAIDLIAKLFNIELSEVVVFDEAW